MSDPHERDGGYFLESVLLGLMLSQVFGLYMMILWEDMMDYEQYIYGRIEATIMMSIKAER